MTWTDVLTIALIGTAFISATGFLITGSIGLILKLGTDLLN